MLNYYKLILSQPEVLHVRIICYIQSVGTYQFHVDILNSTEVLVPLISSVPNS